MAESPLAVLTSDDVVLKNIVDTIMQEMDPEMLEIIAVPKIEVVDSSAATASTVLSYYVLDNIGVNQNAYIRFVLKAGLEPAERVYYLLGSSFSGFDKEDFQDFPVPDINDLEKIEFYSLEWSRGYTNILEGLAKLENIMVPEYDGSASTAEQRELYEVEKGYDDPDSEFWSDEYIGDAETYDPYYYKHYLIYIGSKIYAYYFIICELKADYPDGDYPAIIKGAITNFTGQIANLKGIYDELYEKYLKGMAMVMAAADETEQTTKFISTISGFLLDVNGKAINIFIDIETMTIVNINGQVVDTMTGVIRDGDGNIVARIPIIKAPNNSNAVEATITNADGDSLEVLIDSSTNFFDPNGSYLDLNSIIEIKSQSGTIIGYDENGNPIYSSGSGGSSSGYGYSHTSDTSSMSSVDKFFYDAYNVLDTIESILVTADYILEKAEEILEKIEKFPEMVENFIQKIENAVEKIEKIVDTFLSEDLMNLIENLPEKLLDLFFNLPIIRDILMIKNLIVSQVTQLITLLTSIQLPTSLKSAIRFIRQLKNILSLLHSLVKTVMAIPSMLENSLENTKNYVKGAVQGVVNEVVQPVVQPIMDASGVVTGAVQRVKDVDFTQTSTNPLVQRYNENNPG
jgi:hypothetical protein